MTQYLKNIRAEAEKLQMTPTEKEAIRARLMKEIGATLSPVVVQKTPYFGWFISPRSFAPALALLLLVGVSTASAAQGSLPGDILYPVKISINEQVESAFAVGTEAKAQLHAELANRRLEEAQALAVAGKLHSEAADVLEANFNTHAETAETLAIALEPEKPAVATEVKAKLSNLISTQSAILVELGDDSIDAPTKENTYKLSARVLARNTKHSADTVAFNAVTSKRSASVPAPAAMMAPATLSVTIATEPPVVAEATTMVAADPAAQKTATELHARAIKLLEEARKEYKEISGSLDASTTAQVNAEFTAAENYITNGKAMLEAGDAESAKAEFTAALQTAAKLYTVLKAQAKFERNIIKPLLAPVTSTFEVQLVPDDSGSIELKLR